MFNEVLFLNKKNKLTVIKGIKRNKFAYSAARFLFGRLLMKKYDFKFEPYTPKNQIFILVANHTTPMDPLFEGIAFKQYLRFVASEHLLRKGFVAKTIKFLVNPIPKRRGGDSSKTIEMIVDSLQNGINVCIHAEGYVSINGETGYISPRTAEMIKQGGQALITYRFTGGYFKYPRWASKSRKGPIYGKVINEYSPQQIKEMSLDELNKIIKRDLYVNAFDEQRKNPQKYIGDAPAENLETLLYVCPKCLSLSTLHSKGNELYCDCGYKVTYNEYGFFEGKEIYFDNTLDWDKWQVEFLKKELVNLKSFTSKPITQDPEQILFVADSNGKKIMENDCIISIFADRLVFSGCKNHTYFFKDISHMAMGGATRLNFTCNDIFYEVNSKIVRSSLKYYILYRLLSDKGYII